MTTASNLTFKPFFTPALGKRMLIGFGIGLAVISFFVIGTGAGNLTWGPYWRIRPLLLTPAVGAMVGLCFDVTERLRRLSGWAGKLFWALSLLGYFIGIWLGIVIGSTGTMWN